MQVLLVSSNNLNQELFHYSLARSHSMMAISWTSRKCTTDLKKGKFGLYYRVSARLLLLDRTVLALSQAHSCRKEIVDRHAHHSNLILIHEYKLSFNIEVKKLDDSDSSNNIETLIISICMEKNIGNNKKDIMLHYSNNGKSINDIFRP